MAGRVIPIDGARRREAPPQRDRQTRQRADPVDPEVGAPAGATLDGGLDGGLDGLEGSGEGEWSR